MEPVVKDHNQMRLSVSQVKKIKEYYYKVSSESYSYQFLQDLKKLAFQTRRGLTSQDTRLQDVLDDIVSIDYVLITFFTGKKYNKKKFDPGFEKFLEFSLEKQEKEAKILAQEQELEKNNSPEEKQPEVSEPEEIQTFDDFLKAVPENSLLKISSKDENFLKLQKKLKNSLEELYEAITDVEPEFVIKKITKKVQTVSETLQAMKG